MNDFATVMTKLKTILSQIKRVSVNDKQLALALGITPPAFASMKRRGRLPYRAILDFCVKYQINANSLLFQRPANNYIEDRRVIRYREAPVLNSHGTLEQRTQELTLHDFVTLFIYRAVMADAL